MAIGVAVANSILLVTFSEISREDGMDTKDSAIFGAIGRRRAILMTACAMIAGMIPMALGLGEGAQQTAPLGRAAANRLHSIRMTLRANTMRLSLLGLLFAGTLAAQAIDAVKVTSHPVERKVDLPGEFQPYEQTSVHAKVRGFVQKVMVDRGSHVKEGEVLPC